ncbi:MAG: hypothetical protein LC658_09095 [Bacteroidales bacterium]|nr:hypothetical protein [Bacteroidales bacterium]
MTATTAHHSTTFTYHNHHSAHHSSHLHHTPRHTTDSTPRCTTPRTTARQRQPPHSATPKQS